MTEEERLEKIAALKKQFAYHLLKTPGNTFAVASKVFSKREDVYYASLYWPEDQEVLFYKEEIRNNAPEDEFMPTKMAWAQKINDWIDERDEYGRYEMEARDRIAGGKFYAELRGWTKDEENVSNLPSKNTLNLTVNFVSPDSKENIKTIEASPIVDTEPEDVFNSLPVEINFVAPKER